jgi:hypothetical protein
MSSEPPDAKPASPAAAADAATLTAVEDVVPSSAEIEKTSPNDTAGASASGRSPAQPLPWIIRNQLAANSLWIGLIFALSFVAIFVVRRAFSPVKEGMYRVAAAVPGRSPIRSNDESMQKEAEAMLQQVASGDSAAADRVSEQASTWVGKTTRTNRTDQLITAAINLPDLRLREAALEAELAFDGISKDEAGLNVLTSSVGDPTRRVWALWLLGALGNRGIDPVHTAKIVATYLTDPDVNVRASAVNGLSLIATDETIPMLLDRFRNDSSPLVQERAACGIAESGMYTKAQRVAAAESLINWLDDSKVTGQQRAWDIQALGDISGQHLGTDAAAWRAWYESNR